MHLLWGKKPLLENGEDESLDNRNLKYSTRSLIVPRA